MDRTESARLWAHVQALLRMPEPTDDLQLRRAARMLASSRSDAVELLLAHWLADSRARAVAESAPPPVHPGPQAADTAASGAQHAPVPARAGGRPSLRDAALVTAGVAGGALLVGLAQDDLGVDLDLG